MGGAAGGYFGRGSSKHLNTHTYAHTHAHTHAQINTPSPSQCLSTPLACVPPPSLLSLALVLKTSVTLEGAQKSTCDLTQPDPPTVACPTPSARQWTKSVSCCHSRARGRCRWLQGRILQGKAAAATGQSAGCLLFQVSLAQKTLSHHHTWLMLVWFLIVQVI